VSKLWVTSTKATRLTSLEAGYTVSFSRSMPPQKGSFIRCWSKFTSEYRSAKTTRASLPLAVSSKQATRNILTCHSDSNSQVMASHYTKVPAQSIMFAVALWNGCFCVGAYEKKSDALAWRHFSMTPLSQAHAIMNRACYSCVSIAGMATGSKIADATAVVLSW